jgi:DNA-binding CsgD family transcriptional regulator
MWAGHPHATERLCAAALDSAASPSIRALVRQVEGHLAISCGNLEEAHELLLRAATAEADDPSLVLRLRTEAAMPLVMRGEVAQAAALTDETAAFAAEVSGPEKVFHEGFLAHLRTLSGQAPAREARAAVDRCIETFADQAPTMPAGSLIVHTMAQALVSDGNLLGARDLLARTVAEARRVGALGMLPPVLASLADVLWWLGAWTRAYAAAAEAIELAAETGQPNQRPYGLVVLARIEAVQGRAEVEQHVAEAAALVEQMGSYSLRRYIGAVRGLTALGAGDPEAAVRHLERVAEGVAADGMKDPSLIPWAPDLVEAYVALDRAADAERIAAELQQQAQTSGNPWAAAAAWRCRGLLAADGELDATFARAMELHEHLPLPFERARTELCWGQRLRRAGRRRDAADHLARALTTLEGLDASPWAARARTELRACGSPVRAQEPGAVHQLTLKEVQVAQHAAEGLTNREIAATLFVSPKTVENHLGRIYDKLGVRSRTELAVVLHRHAGALLTAQGLRG